MFEQYRRDLPYYILSKGSAVASWVFIVWFLTHNLSPQQYGEYGLLFSLLTLASLVTTSWLNSSIYRYLPEHAEANDLRNFQAIIFRLAGVTVLCGLVVFGVVLAIMDIIGFTEAGILALSSVAIAFAANCAFILVTAYLSAKRSLREYAISSGGQVILFAAVLWLALAHFEAKTAVIFLAMTVSYLPTLLLAGRGTARHSVAIAAKAREYMRYGLPLMLVSSATLINMYGDQFLIRFFTSNTEVGLYSANYLFAERSILSLASVLTVAYLPILFRIWERGDKEQAYRFIWKMALLLLAMLLPVELILVFFGDWIASLFIDAAYSSANSIIPIVGLSTIVTAVAGIFADVMTMQKRTMTIAYCYVLGAAANIAMNCYVIPVFGYKSAAFSTLASSLILLCSILFSGQRVGRIFLYAVAK